MEHSNYHTYHTLIRGVLYLGVFTMLGMGIFARWVGPELAAKRSFMLRYFLLLGFVGALGSTLYGIWHTLQMLGGVSWLEYLNTYQGQVVLGRTVLLSALLALGLRTLNILYVPLALGLLLTISLSGHAALGGLRLWVDWLHLTLGVVWGGSVIALAVAWYQYPVEQRLALRRVSALGMVCFLLLSVLGVVLAVQSFNKPQELWESRYGQLLLLKVGLVLAVIGLAAFNRSKLGSLAARLRLPSLSAEAIVIAAILSITGVLASTEPPPPAAALVSLVNVSGTLEAGSYSGQIYAQGGYLHFFLEIKNASGKPIAGKPIVLEVTGPQNLKEVVKPIQHAQYHLALLLERGLYTVRFNIDTKPLSYELWVSGR
jgi:putative copper export protein